jgi:hypothetical protein
VLATQSNTIRTVRATEVSLNDHYPVADIMKPVVRQLVTFTRRSWSPLAEAFLEALVALPLGTTALLGDCRGLTDLAPDSGCSRRRGAPTRDAAARSFRTLADAYPLRSANWLGCNRNTR